MNQFLHLIERRVAKAAGLVRYFTGRPCSRGHVSERRTSIGHCVECLREIHRSPKVVAQKNARYQADKGRVLEKSRQWREANPDRHLENRRRYYRENTEEIKAKVVEWRTNNPEAFTAQNRKNYLSLSAEAKARRLEYSRENLAKDSARKARRKANKLACANLGPPELTDFVYAEALTLCKARERVTGFPWQVDHCVPINGKTFTGLHVYYNLQCLPAKINAFKQAKLIFTEPYEWVGAKIWE